MCYFMGTLWVTYFVHYGPNDGAVERTAPAPPNPPQVYNAKYKGLTLTRLRQRFTSERFSPAMVVKITTPVIPCYFTMSSNDILGWRFYWETVRGRNYILYLQVQGEMPMTSSVHCNRTVLLQLPFIHTEAQNGTHLNCWRDAKSHNSLDWLWFKLVWFTNEHEGRKHTRLHFKSSVVVSKIDNAVFLVKKQQQ
jgi:hypothetical protein